MKSILLFLVSIIFSISSFSQVYTFASDVSGAPATVASNMTASNITRIAPAAAASSPCGSNFSGAGWNGGTGTSNGAYEIQLIPNSGYKLDLTSFTFGLRRSGTGPTGAVFYYSIDNGGTWAVDPTGSRGVPSVSCTGSYSSYTWSFSSTVTATNTTYGIKFRIWAQGGSSGGSFTVKSGSVAGAVNVASCSGTPTAGTAVAATTNICTSGTSALSVTGSTAGTGLTYQWQSSPDNSTWTDITSATNTTYTSGTLTATTYFRRKITCTASSSTSTTASVAVTVTSITSPPITTTIAAGTGATFTVNSTAPASYQWQRSTTGTGGTYVNITSATLDATGTYSGYTTTSTATSNTLTLATVPYGWNGYAYRCVVTNTCGNVTSSDATLNVTTTGCTGTPAAGTATAVTSNLCTSGSTTINLTGYTAATDITYQWQSSSDSASWTDVSGATNVSYTTPTITASTYYRCITNCTTLGLTNASNGALVSVTTVVSSPSASTISAGSGTSFTVNSTAPASYQWQRSATGTAGTYVNITSATLDVTGTYSGYTTSSTSTSNTLTLASVPLNWNGYAYRCVVTNTCGNVNSAGAVLNVPCSGTPATGTATATSPSICGTGATTITLSGYSYGAGISFQWQSSSDSASWTNITSATNSSYTTPTISATTYYRCISSCSYSTLSNNSNGAKVTVLPAPTVAAISYPTLVGSAGNTISMTNSSTGVTNVWSTSSASIASVSSSSSSAVVYLVSGGSATIGYTVTNSFGCSTNTSVTVNVNCVPSITASTDKISFTTSGALSNITTYTPTNSPEYNNQSGSLGIVATPGSTISFSGVNSTPTYAGTVTIWVDWNQSGTFADSTSELVYTSGSIASGGAFSGSFVVPTTVRPGITTMRVAFAEHGMSSPCVLVSATYGNVIDFFCKVPGISVTRASLPFGYVNLGSSAGARYNVSAANLSPSSGNITITAPSSQYLLSTDSTTFSSSLSVAYGGTTAGALASTPIYVKYTPTSLSSSGNISNAGGGATTQNVAVSGSGAGFLLAPTTINFASISPSATLTNSISFSGQNLSGSGNIAVTSTDSHFQVSLSSGSGFASSVNVPYASGVLSTGNPTTIYVQFTPGAVGSYSGNINFSGGGFSANDTVLGNGAVLCTSPTGAPTGLGFSSTNSSGTTLNFTAYTAVPDSYLVVSSLPSALSGAPVDGTRYPSGAAVGTNGTSRGTFGSAADTITGLAGNTNYYLTVFPLNNVTCYGGPLYYTTAPLSGNTTTCPAAPATTSTTSVTSTGFTVNWASSAGGGASAVSYQLQVATDTAFTAQIAGSPFTTSALSMAINSGINMNTTYYYRVTATGACTSNPSTRGTVPTPCNNPTITASASTALLCYGSNDTVTLSGAGIGGAYSWTPSASVSGAGSVFIVNPTASTSYTVTGTNSYGCSSTLAYVIPVSNAIVGLTISPATTTLCSGGSQLLSVSGTPTIVSDNFNGTPLASGWLADGATPWQQANSGYAFSTTTVNSFDASKMYLVNNYAAGLVTSSHLTSPLFSLAGLSAANFSFYDYYDLGGGETFVGAEISINGGSTWSTLYTASNNSFGGTRTLAAHSVSLSSYLGNASVKIRFTYNANAASTYVYAVDNPVITGTAAPVWAPSNGLFTNASATTSYSSGTGAAGVYAAAYAGATTATNTYTASMGACAIGSTATVNTKPIVYNITGGDGCTATGVTIGLSGSQTSVNYQLNRNGVAIGSAVAGTGAALSFGFQTTAGAYSITANSLAGCTVPMNGNVVVSRTPVAYALSSGTVCSADSITISLANSDTGINYQLYNGASTFGSSVAGTGSSITLGRFGTPGIFTVVASSSSVCNTTMTGSDTINSTPSIVLGGNPSICQPLSATNISYSSPSGIPGVYNLTWGISGATAGFSDVSGGTLSGGAINLPIPTTSVTGSFPADITVSNGLCLSSTYHFTLTAYANPTASFVTPATPCSGYATTIAITGTAGADVFYTIDGGSTLTGTLTGGSYSFSSGPLTSAHTYLLVNAHNPVCTTAVGTPITIAPTPMQWTGSVSADWNTAANWTCGFAPGSSDNVTIPSGTTNAPDIAASASGATGNLAIATGVTVTVNNGAALNVNGNLINKGNVTGLGVLSMVGSSAQTVSEIGSVKNFDVNNTFGVTVATSARLTIKSTLSVTAGSLATNDSVVLYSDSLGSARVAALPTGASITGMVKVNQYFAGGRRAYRFWAHPFNDFIPLSQVFQAIDISGLGGATNGFINTATNAPSSYRYNPYSANSTIAGDPGWKPFTSTYATPDSNKFKRYQGIRIYYRGAKGEGTSLTTYTPSATVASQWGVLNQGNQNVPLMKGTSTGQDYNMVGNPYPSPVDIGTVIFNAAAAGRITGGYFYIWNPFLNTAGQFQAVAYSTGGATPTAIPYYLQTNNAFQVRAAHDGDLLNFTESNKSANISAAYSLMKTKNDLTALYLYDANYHPYDMFYVDFNDGATDEEDAKYDGGKPSGAEVNFYSLSADSHKLCVDARPYQTNTAIALGVSSNYAQDYIIKAENMAVPNGGQLYLHDKLLQQYVLLQQGTEYRFSVTKDGNTQGEQRFELTSNKPATEVVAASGLNVTMTPNPTSDNVKITFTQGAANTVSIRIIDLSGASVYNEDLGMKQNGAVTVPLTNIASGVYMVELTSGDKKVVQRLIKE